MSVKIDAERLKEIRSALGLSQEEMARAIGLGGTNPDRTLRLWEAGQTITGPAQTAIAYLGQGALDDAMKKIVPEFLAASPLPETAGGREYVIRLWRPRFLAVVMPAAAPIAKGTRWAWIEPRVERLAVAMWIDDPEAPPGFDARELVERAASLFQAQTLDDFADSARD